jgi:hypothetical protein
VVSLLGYTLAPPELRPGATSTPVEATLCWQTHAAPTRDYAFALHVVSRDGVDVVAGRDSHFGMGRYPASSWVPGRVFCDVFDLPLIEQVTMGRVYRVEVAVYDPTGGDRLPGFGADSTRRPDDFVGWVRAPAAPDAPPDIALLPEPYRLGDAIELAGYAVTPNADEATLQVRLVWHMVADVHEPYTVLLHVVPASADPTGRAPVAQGDRPPEFPTWAWRAGEWVDETYTVLWPEPDAAYRLLVGLYRPGDLTRLPVTRGGARLPDDVVVLDVE